MPTQLPSEQSTELNPFNPAVPDSVRQLAPELYDFLRDMAETIREQHGKNLGGDTTLNWQSLLLLDESPRYTLGAEGRFYHPEYGILRARYVQFSKFDSELPLGGPVGLLRLPAGFKWTVTNVKSLTLDGKIRGIPAAYTVPADETYGWVLTQAVSLQSLDVGTAQPKQGDKLTWDDSGAITLNGEGDQLIGYITGVATQVDGRWILPPAGLFIDSADLTTPTRPGTVAPEPTALIERIVELEEEVKQSSAFVRQSTSILARRVEKVTQQLVEASSTETLQAMATFLQLAGVNASNATTAANRTEVNLLATVESSRFARVFRDEAGVFAETAATLVTMSQAASAIASTQATASQTFSTQAGVHAAAALSSETLSASYLATITDVVTGANAAVTAESAARVAADNAISTTVTANFASLTGSIGTVDARVTSTISAQATVNAATASSLSSLSASFGGLSATVTTQAAVTADHTGKLSAYWTVSAVAGGRAQLSVYADANGGGGVDIGGDLRVFGKIGLFRESTSGARLELEGNQIRGYHTSGVLGLFLGIV